MLLREVSAAALARASLPPPPPSPLSFRVLAFACARLLVVLPVRLLLTAAMPLFGKKDVSKKTKKDAEKALSIDDKYDVKDLLGT